MKEAVNSVVLFFGILFDLVKYFVVGMFESEEEYQQKCVERDNEILEELLFKEK